MTEPLIDRDKVTSAIYWKAILASTPEETAQMAADAVLDYLRSVLTPAALEPTEWVSGDPDSSTGLDLHRRIFGEDE